MIALIVAMSGTSYAVTQLPRNSVGTTQLKKNAVSTVTLRKNAVSTLKIRNNAITTAKIRGGAITGAKLSSTALGSQRSYDAPASCSARGSASDPTWVALGDAGAYAAGAGGQGLMCPLDGLPTDARITRLQVQYLDDSDPDNLIFFIGSWNPASGSANLDAEIQTVSTGRVGSIRTLTVTPNAQQAEALSTQGGRVPVVRVDGATSDTRNVVGILVDYERVLG